MRINPEFTKLLKAPAVALIGAVALSGCANAEVKQDDSITCSGSKLVTVEKGDTMTRIIRNESSDGSLGSAQIHNIVTGVSEIWKDEGRNAEMPDILEIDPANQPVHNTYKLPALQEGEIITVPTDCKANS